jgi:hypothetical protein
VYYENNSDNFSNNAYGWFPWQKPASSGGLSKYLGLKKKPRQSKQFDANRSVDQRDSKEEFVVDNKRRHKR